MNNVDPTEPEPVPPVRVRRHPVDWEAADLAEITAERAMSLGPQLQQGCWYLCPRFTVSSPAPTAEFFRTVLERRSSWLRTCRQVLGNHGQRRLARQVANQGRQGALLTSKPDAAGEAHSHRAHQSMPLADLHDNQRREVIEAGQLAKQLSLSGILLIDGAIVPPRTWQALADQLLAPETAS